MPSRSAELRTWFEKLGSSKITDRRKAAERLKCLLGTADYLRQLDKGSGGSDEGLTDDVVTWTNLLEGAEGALVQELKSQKSAAANLKKLEMYGLVKIILLKAKGRQLPDGRSAISLDAVAEHISVILSEYSHLLASEYAILLVNCFISNSIWIEWTNPNLSLLGKILVKFMKGIAKTLPGFNAGPISQAIRVITISLCDRIDIKPSRYLNLHKEFFLNTKESNSQTLESMLASVNKLCECSAVTSRLQITQFGEDIALRLLQLWQNNVKEPCKLEMVRFFSLQIITHHDTESAQADTWQDVLWKLYELMYQELSNTKTSLQLSRNKLPTLWTDEFIKLLADVCLILLPRGERLYEVSQMASQSQLCTSKPAKRRRITSGWESLKSNITDSQDHHTQIAWIRVLRGMVRCDDRGNLEVDKLTDLLDVMIQLLSSTKRALVLTEIQQCLSVLASRSDVTSAEDNEIKWRQVIAYSANLVERSQPDFYELLVKLLKIGKLSDKQLLIRLIRHSITTPVSHQSLRWLQHFLAQHQLVMYQLLSQTERELSPLAASHQGAQQELWQHLWVCDQLTETVSDEEGYCKVVTACDVSVCPKLYGGIIAALVCKEPVLPDESLTQKQSPMEEIHSIYEQMAFNAPKDSLPAVVGTLRTPSLLMCVKPSIEQKLQDRLELSRRLLTSVSDYKTEYLADGLWMIAMVDSYLHITHQRAGAGFTLLPAAIALCDELLVQVTDHLTSSSISADRPYLSRLVTIMEYQHSLIHLSNRIRAYNSSLIAFIHKVLESSHSQTNNGTTSRINRTSASNSMFDDDDDFAVPEVPETTNSQESQESDSGKLTNMKPAELDMLNAFKCLVLSALPDTHSDVTGLIAKLSIPTSSVSHAYIAKQTLSLATERWTSVDHETFTHLLFRTRELIERYYSDPQMGVSSLDLLTQIIPSVSQSEVISDEEREELGSKIFYVMNGLVSQMFDRIDEDDSYLLLPLFDLNYRISLIDCLSQLIKADRDDSWKLAAGRMGPMTLDPHLYLIKSLLDRHYAVRRHAICKIHVLFERFTVQLGAEPKSSTEQDASFEKIYTEITKILAVPENTDELEKFDEQATRTSTLLSLFSTIITCSPACSKKSLCALFLFLDEANQHVNSHLIHKVLDKVVSSTPYSTVSEMSQINLQYVVHEWITIGYRLATFPIKLAGYEDISEFYRCNASLFVPRVLSNDDLWTELCDITGIEPPKLITDHMDHILQHLLPAISSSTGNFKENKRLLEKCTNILAKQDIQIIQTFRAKLSDILFSLYTSAWDYTDLYPGEPQPSPPFYTKSEVTTTLEYLLKMFHKKGVSADSLISMLASDMASVTALHCRLATYLTSGKHIHELRQRCASYLHFINDLLPEMMTSLYRCQLHLTESITSVVINAISTLERRSENNTDKYVTSVITQLLDCFQSLFCLLVEDCSLVLRGVVPRVTYSLVPLTAHTDPAVNSAARDLLTLIWTTYGSKFEHLLPDMEPFPQSVMRYIPHEVKLPDLCKVSFTVFKAVFPIV